MSLRIKSLLVAMVTMGVLLVTFLIFTRLIVTNSYTQLEQADTAEHVARAANALHNELSTLARTTNDYAAWDDTYNFMESRVQAYLQSQFQTGYERRRLIIGSAGRREDSRGGPIHHPGRTDAQPHRPAQCGW